MELTAEEVRVTGCLLEKQRTTPDVYPMTLNALVTACNQTSSRWPVVRYDDVTVSGALDSLRAANLVRLVHSPSNRATKYRHVLDEALEVDEEMLVVLCVLLLRGPQTAAEIRSRSERLHAFDSVAQVDEALDRLQRRDEALVVRLARRPGQKEQRFAHLLAGAPDEETLRPSPAGEERWVASPGPVGAGTADRLQALEAEVAALRADLDVLRAELTGPTHEPRSDEDHSEDTQTEDTDTTWTTQAPPPPSP